MAKTVAQLQAGYDKINARNGNDDYFTRMQAAYSADPEAYNAKVDKAKFPEWMEHLRNTLGWATTN
ncbi:MAG TPA: hypothetical protein VK772_18415 [Puia sp.]|jgi:hypothetical protein|nr:hypothetical protein [Puia sp.]